MLRCTLLFTLLLAVPTATLAAEGDYRVVVGKDVVYGLGVSGAQESGFKSLLMDTYLPENCPDPLKPAVIIVHGGQFRFLDKSQRPHVASGRFFAARGFAAFCIDYRQVQDLPETAGLSERCATYLAQQAALADCRAAVRWIRANAALYGIDPEKVVGIGSSAGGTCMYGMAFDDTADEMDGAYPSDNPGYSSRLQACVALWGNPAQYLRSVDEYDSPILFVHGLYDPKRDTPLGPVLKLQENLNVAGVPYEFLPLDVPGHALWEARVDEMAIAELALDFFIRQLGR
ncbi:MAG TPA: alpha/beta hydrolase [Candidatus Hydrogenedentes bacterium]|nr:alpha/beta hydrolase [Candidatus Hydrogenedentota bacterium]